jgi:lipopolysaccharide/colanic/teichoic acid biosynthesis glycosyltransferase
MVRKLFDAQDVPEVSAVYHTFSPPACACKRAFDLIVAGAAVAVLLPVFVVIAVLIKLDSPGPVFFAQVRVGRYRRRFRMWKFRKMYHDLPEQGPSLTRRYDARLTRVGQFLERTKLDELPQLFNVLRGDMSVVGPRPEVPQFVEHYPEEWDRVLSVTPGLLGPCQVRFRNESELYPENCQDLEGYYVKQILPEKLVSDAAYAARYSVVRDVVLLVHTVFVALGGTVTGQTLANRRWQIINTVILSLAGVLGTVACLRFLGRALSPDAVAWTILAAAVAKPLCVIAFKVPKALATSVTAHDMIRCCWCAAVSGSMIACALLYAEFRGLGRAVLVADSMLFLTILVVYKLACYNAYHCFYWQESRHLWRRLILASALIGPAAMAAVLSVRHGLHSWVGPHAAAGVALVLLAAAGRTAVTILKPIGYRQSLGSWLLREWPKLLLGSVIGTSLIVSGAVLLNERAVGRGDLACDAALYLLLTTAAALWWQARHPHTAFHRQLRAAPAKEKLLIVGDGVGLGTYIDALSALPEHRFEVVGALTPHRGFRTKMAGGVPVLGEVPDAAQVVSVLGVTRVVVIDAALGNAEVEEMRQACGLSESQVLRVELLAPVLRLAADAEDAGGDVRDTPQVPVGSLIEPAC